MDDDIQQYCDIEKSNIQLSGPSNESVLDEFLKEQYSSATSPSQINYEKREKVVDEIRSQIEKLIKDRWDIFEYSRLFDTNSLDKAPTFEEIKIALAPYVAKGWYATISFISPKNENIMLTYEANSLFLTSKKFINRSFQERVFVRMYPRVPIKIPYIGNVIFSNKLFGILQIGAICSTALLSWLISPLFAIAGALIFAIITGMNFYFGKSHFAIIRKKIAGDKFGPLLWADNIQGYRTSHKTVTRDERIKEVIKNRVLSYEYDYTW